MQKDKNLCFTNVSLMKRNQRGCVPMVGGKQWLSSGDISYCGSPWTVGGKDYCFQATIHNFTIPLSSHKREFPGYQPQSAERKSAQSILSHSVRAYNRTTNNNVTE